MQDFLFYVTDDRDPVPSTMVVKTKSEASARAMAKRLLANGHYHTVEVWSAAGKLFSLSEARA